MVADLVKPELPDSELVIGSNLETAQTEILLVRQVQTRRTLHQEKPTPREFTTVERWIDRCGERALSQLVKSHDRRICSIVIKHQKNKSGSADVDLRQEAIATFINAIYRFDASKGAALYSYAYFRIQARLQQLTEKENHYKIAKAKSFAEEEGYSFSALNDLYGQEQLNTALSRLPERQQDIIWARQRDESFSVIAERVQSSLKTVQNLFYSGLRKLRSLLGLSSAVAPITPQPEKVAPTQETQPEAVEVAQVELVAVSEPIVEPAIEPSAAEACPPESKSERKFRKIRALFRILPITNSEAVKPFTTYQQCFSLERFGNAITRISRQPTRFTHALQCPTLYLQGDSMPSTRIRPTPPLNTPRLLLAPGPKRSVTPSDTPIPPFPLTWPALSVMGLLSFLIQWPLAMVGVPVGMLVNLIVFSGPISGVKKRLKILGMASGTVALAYASPGFAATVDGTTCPGGILSQVVGILVKIATAAGITSVTTDLCLINQITTVVAAMLFIGTLLAGIFRASRDNNPGEAFAPFGWALLALVGSGVISKIFFGSFV